MENEKKIIANGNGGSRDPVRFKILRYQINYIKYCQIQNRTACWMSRLKSD